MPLKLNPVTCELDLVISGGGGGAGTITGDSGGALSQTAGNWDILGGTGINTAGAVSTLTINLDSPVIVANGGTGATSLTDGGILLGSGVSAITVTAQPTDGQLLTGFSGSDPVLATLTAGTGIGITNGSGSITIDSVGGGFTWNDVVGTSDDFEASNGYIANNAGLVTITLPTTCAVGDSFKIVGLGAGGWRIAQNASQVIHFGNMDTTTGVVGMLDSTNRYDCVEFLCVVLNNEFVVLSSVGNITVT